MTAPLNLAEAFLLLALKDDGKRSVQGRDLDTGLAGAVLSDLVVTRSIDLQGKDVVLTPQSGTIPFLVPFVEQIRAAGKSKSAKHWVRAFRSKDLRARVESSLVAQGLVTSAPGKTFGLFPTTLFPSTHSEVERVVKSRVDAVLSGAEKPDEWTASLIAVCDATGVLKKAFGPVSKQRIKQITEGEWASAAVKKIIAQANAAVRSAVISTVAANGSNSGN